MGELTASDSNTLIDKNGSVIATWKDANETDGTVAGYYDGDNLVYAADKALEEGAKVNPGLDLSTREAADKAVSTVNTALEAVSSERSLLGAMQIAWSIQLPTWALQLRTCRRQSLGSGTWIWRKRL